MQNPQHLVGAALGALWSVVVVLVGLWVIEIPIFLASPSLAFATLGPGISIGVMLGWRAFKKWRDSGIEPQSASRGSVDQDVLRNSVEHAVFALCLWPAIVFLHATDGPGVVISLGASFLIARSAYWIGSHCSAVAQAFGRVGTNGATVAALVIGVGRWLT